MTYNTGVGLDAGETPELVTEVISMSFLAGQKIIPFDLAGIIVLIGFACLSCRIILNYINDCLSFQALSRFLFR